MPYIEVPVTWVYKSPSVIPICNSIPRFSNISQFLYKKKCLFMLWLCVTWIGLTVCRLRLFFFSLAASWFFLQYYDARQSACLYVLALWLLSTVNTLPSINRCTCNNEFWPWFKIDPEVIFNVEYYDEWCFGFNFQRRKKKPTIPIQQIFNVEQWTLCQISIWVKILCYTRTDHHIVFLIFDLAPLWRLFAALEMYYQWWLGYFPNY